MCFSRLLILHHRCPDLVQVRPGHLDGSDQLNQINQVRPEYYSSWFFSPDTRPRPPVDYNYQPYERGDAEDVERETIRGGAGRVVTGRRGVR